MERETIIKLLASMYISLNSIRQKLGVSLNEIIKEVERQEGANELHN